MATSTRNTSSRRNKKNFIPTTEASARVWMNNFVAHLQEDCAAFGLNKATLASVKARVDAFSEALDIASAPATRTTVSIREKRAAHKEAIDAVRQIARMIRANPQVTDAQRAKLDLARQSRSKPAGKVSRITAQPMLEIKTIEDGGHVLRYCDAATPHSSGRPDDRYYLQLFAVLSSEPVLDPEQARFVGMYRTRRITTKFEFDPERRFVTYFARWGVANGVVGPWSEPVVSTLAFASAQMMQTTTRLKLAAA